MAGLLAAFMVAVVAYCLARSFVPALRNDDHRRDIDAWHVVMGSAMVAMLLAPFSQGPSLLALGVFATGLVISLVQVGRQVARAAYVGLAVGCAAMTAMLLPTATATAAEPGAASHLEHHHHATDHGGGSSLLSVPTFLVAAVFAALALLLVARLLQSMRASGPLSGRVDALCEATMAVAMGYLLLLMV